MKESRPVFTLDQKLRPHPDAVDTELDGDEVALLHLETKSYYSLNLTGMRIWQGLKQGLSLREISRLLQDEFRVECGDGGPERPGAGRRAGRSESGAGGRIAEGRALRVENARREPVAGMGSRALLRRARRCNRARETARPRTPERADRLVACCRDRLPESGRAARLLRAPAPPAAARRATGPGDPQERVRRDGRPKRRSVPGPQDGPRSDLGGAHAGHRPEGRGAGGDGLSRTGASSDGRHRPADPRGGPGRGGAPAAKRRLRGRARPTDEGRAEDGATTIGSFGARVRAPATFRSSSTGISIRPDGRPRGTSRRSSSGPIASRLRGHDALVLCAEDFLLHLCVHLCRHRFNGGVIALCDIAATISHHGDRLDWARFERLAAAARRFRYAFVPLRLAADLMGADVPAPVLASLRASRRDDRSSSSPARGFSRKRETSAGLRSCSSGGGAEARAAARRRPGGRSCRRTRGASRAATNPDSLRSFYLAHLADLLRRYAPWLWALARHPRLVSSRRRTRGAQVGARFLVRRRACPRTILPSLPRSGGG